MRAPVTRVPEAEIRRDFPIEGKTAGWFFRMRETSNGAWVVEGTDAWGRRVSRDGTDPERLLSECEADAAAATREIGDA